MNFVEEIEFMIHDATFQTDNRDISSIIYF